MESTDGAPGGPLGDERAALELQALAVQLRRMNGEINRLVHSFAHAQGLHATDVQALAAILDADAPLTPGRLRDHLGLTSGAVTACLDRLERSGHVRRSRDSADRRVVHLHYEPTAKSVARSFFMPLAEAAATAQALTEPGEMAAALRFVTRMNEALTRTESPRR
ncbi:MarR family transcriptional regulator [Streptomyces sp. NBC_01754]|uniref:MarR family transcriptional regulator n=1 Tax=Streptomyces sp. NBC_01754 TaxID=2975930 RepID=UPI002DD917F1|nr:MarR family transcriptional regulator [Streptomyces sp. NBC_01754]WSC96250.1 MarR family transcriptional regulator [Streptomyces sp. NBC_01754]